MMTHRRATVDDKLVTPKELAEALRVSAGHIRNMCSRGELPAIRVGGTWRIWQRAALQAMTRREESA
jgi:excisionase family DNA binding protein